MCLNEFNGFLISMWCKAILKTASNNCMTVQRNNFQKWYPGSSERIGLEISLLKSLWLVPPWRYIFVIFSEQNEVRR